MSGMVAYFTRRLLLVPFTFIAITLMVYSVLRVVPGGPIEQAETAMKLSAMQGEAGSGGGSSDITNEGELQLDEDSLKALQRYYALDRPIIIGYMQWLGIWPREHRTRIQKKTMERRPDVFGPLRRLKDAETTTQDTLDALLAEHELIYTNGRFYEQALDPSAIDDASPSSSTPDNIPHEVVARMEAMRKDGFSGRDKHLEWLAKRGYTAVGRTLYRRVEPDNHRFPKSLFESADAMIQRIAYARLKLDRIQEDYGYEIESSGNIYKIEAQISGILQLDFGRSYTHGKSVVKLIVSKMEVSIQFGLIGYIMTWLVCIPLGVFKALKHRSIFDTGTSFVVFLGYSMPGFVVCLVLISTVAVNVDWLPLGGYKPSNIEDMTLFEAIFGRMRHMLIPVIGYMVGGFATMTILMKNSLLDNLGADYVRTGFAKGLSEKRVVFVHALRNSLIPITAGIGHAIGLLFAGSFLIEKTCNIDGMGLLGYEAVIQRDYPIIMATLVIGVLIRLFGNIISDIVWAIIDPRIRFG